MLDQQGFSGPIPMLLFFMPIFCNTQTTIESQSVTAMKKRITWNSAQTRVTKIVKNYGRVRRKPSAYSAKPGSKCCVIDQFIGIIAEGSKYCTLHDAVGGLRVMRNSTENLR